MLAFYYIRTTATLDVVTKKDVGPNEQKIHGTIMR